MQAGDRELRGRLLGGLTRNVFLLGLVSLCTDLGSQMGFPLLPLFLTSVLGAGAFTVGIVEGAAETTASPSRSSRDSGPIACGGASRSFSSDTLSPH